MRMSTKKEKTDMKLKLLNMRPSTERQKSKPEMEKPKELAT